MKIEYQRNVCRKARRYRIKNEGVSEHKKSVANGKEVC